MFHNIPLGTWVLIGIIIFLCLGFGYILSRGGSQPSSIETDYGLADSETTADSQKNESSLEEITKSLES